MAHDRITYGLYTWDFVALVGSIQVPQRVLKTIKMPGVDGKAFKELSIEAQPGQLIMLAPALNQADEEDWIASMFGLSGAGSVTIYSGTEVPYYNRILTNMVHRSSERVAVGAYAGVSLGSTGRLLTFEATIEYPFGS